MFDDEMLTIEDLAAYLKLKPQTIYKWAQSGKIPGAKFGKEWRFRRSHIEDWIDHRMAEYGAPPGRGKASSRDAGTRTSREETDAASDGERADRHAPPLAQDDDGAERDGPDSQRRPGAGYN